MEPISNLETPIRFNPGLISNIKVKAVLNNFTRFDNLFIQVFFLNIFVKSQLEYHRVLVKPKYRKTSLSVPEVWPFFSSS